mmetsp:Transcript_35183/g.64246  ORF Transcript_35183/g.64246 Transcript_35183/m.64246 type:complete len:236 (+) Transcript_35183:102-809(+)
MFGSTTENTDYPPKMDGATSPVGLGARAPRSSRTLPSSRSTSTTSFVPSDSDGTLRSILPPRRSWADMTLDNRSDEEDESQSLHTMSGESRPQVEPVPSVGSEGHNLGLCRPCIFFPKAVGCENGRNCAYCHLEHDSRARHRRHLRNMNRQTSRSDAEDNSLEADRRRGNRRGCRSPRKSPSTTSSVSNANTRKVAFMFPTALVRTAEAASSTPSSATSILPQDDTVTSDARGSR